MFERIKKKKYRNQLTKELRKAPKKYYNESFSLSFWRTDMWKNLNSVLNRRETSTSDDSIISDDNQLGGIPLANAFKDYFANIANRASNCTHTYKINGQGNNNSIFFCRY